MKTLYDFVKDHKITISSERIDQNPYDPEWQANHYKCVLRRAKKQMTVYFLKGYGLKGKPTAKEVLNCLAMNAACIENCRDFREWCAELGYNIDDRQAKKIYNACLKETTKLKKFLMQNAYNELLWETERL